MRIGWYGSEGKFVLLLIHLKSEVRPRRWICLDIKSIAFEVKKRKEQVCDNITYILQKHKPKLSI